MRAFGKPSECVRRILLVARLARGTFFHRTRILAVAVAVVVVVSRSLVTLMTPVVPELRSLAVVSNLDSLAGFRETQRRREF